MDKYPAFDERPLDRCLKDIAHADVYVLLISHRYGHRPHIGNPKGRSITQLEYEEAIRHPTKPRLVFTVDRHHPWDPGSTISNVSRIADLCNTDSPTIRIDIVPLICPY